MSVTREEVLKSAMKLLRNMGFFRRRYRILPRIAVLPKDQSINISLPRKTSSARCLINAITPILIKSMN